MSFVPRLIELDHPHPAIEDKEFIIIRNFPFLQQHLFDEHTTLDVAVCPLFMMGREVGFQPSCNRLVQLDPIDCILFRNETIEFRTMVGFDDKRVWKAIEIDLTGVFGDLAQRNEKRFPDLFFDVVAHLELVAGQRDERIPPKYLLVLNQLVECLWKQEESKISMVLIVAVYDIRICGRQLPGNATEKLEDLPRPTWQPLPRSSS